MAVIAAIFISGYTIGLNNQKVENIQKEAKETAAVVKVEKSLQTVSDDVAVKQQEREAEIKIVYKPIIKEVIKYVKENPDANDVVDADFGLLFNASSKGCDVTEPTCRAESSIPEGTTNAQLIETATEQHQIYQECRSTVIGWQEFYSKLKKEIDDVNAGKVKDSMP